MRRLVHPLRVRPHLSSALLVGLAVGLLAPAAWAPSTRALVGWNAGVWLYLGLVVLSLGRADAHRLTTLAREQAESAGQVLVGAALAVVASLAGVVVELVAARQPGHPAMGWHVGVAALTVAGSWLLIGTLFSLAYAAEYYRHPQPQGLRFVDDGEGWRPAYGDFLYVAFTLAVASQTADVAISSARMRRWVLAQSVLAFAFNAAILAFAVNLAAGLI